jgi:hypothetical protein
MDCIKDILNETEQTSRSLLKRKSESEHPTIQGVNVLCASVDIIIERGMQEEPV